MPWVDMKNVVEANPPTDREVRQVEDFVRRKAKPRFYADENFPRTATAILRKLGADVLTVQEARRQRHPDENHKSEALRLGRVLITCDRDYLNEECFPLISCPAIVVCDFGRGTVREILDTFHCLTSIFRAPQIYDKWSKIDAKRDSWKEYARHLDGTTSTIRLRLYRGRMQEWLEN